MVNFIIPNLTEVDDSLQDSKGLRNNFKIIQQSKSSQKPHLKDLGTESKATKEFGHEIDTGTEK